MTSFFVRWWVRFVWCDIVYVGLIVDIVGGSLKRSCFDSRRIPVVIKVEGGDDIVDLHIQRRIYILQV
jgi:hypothetical protein